MSERRAVVFFNRDGIVAEDSGMAGEGGDLRLAPDAVEALLRLQEHYLLVGFVRPREASCGGLVPDRIGAANARLDEVLPRAGVEIQEWYVCPHQLEDGCSCFAPDSQFVLKAATDYSLDLPRCFVVGDHPRDALVASELGAFGLYLLTSNGGGSLGELPAGKLVFHRLGNAADWILEHPDHERSIARKIELGAWAIQEGGVVAFPTETVYGLGADVFNPAAVSRLFEIKKRPKTNPLIAHVSDVDQIHGLAAAVPEKALRLMERFWPGPLTVVLPKKPAVPDVVTGGNPTVAIRMPKHPIALELIRRAGTPLAAPSANTFSCVSPTTAQHVVEQLGDACDVVIDGGACRVGVESTVVSFTGPHPVILRPGGLCAERIEAEIGAVHPVRIQAGGGAESPGLLPNHYAPETKLSVFSRIPARCEGDADTGILLFQPSETAYAGKVEVLSASGSVDEAAVNLYAALRRLDAMGLREIAAERAPEQGLGAAVNNRLLKASRGQSF